jgi:hypothetical protein
MFADVTAGATQPTHRTFNGRRMASLSLGPAPQDLSGARDRMLGKDAMRACILCARSTCPCFLFKLHVDRMQGVNSK